jgi:hypothetical protein
MSRAIRRAAANAILHDPVPSAEANMASVLGEAFASRRPFLVRPPVSMEWQADERRRTGTTGTGRSTQHLLEGCTARRSQSARWPMCPTDRRRSASPGEPQGCEAIALAWRGRSGMSYPWPQAISKQVAVGAVDPQRWSRETRSRSGRLPRRHGLPSGPDIIPRSSIAALRRGRWDDGGALAHQLLASEVTSYHCGSARRPLPGRGGEPRVRADGHTCRRPRVRRPPRRPPETDGRDPPTAGHHHVQVIRRPGCRKNSRRRELVGPVRPARPPLRPSRRGSPTWSRWSRWLKAAARKPHRQGSLGAIGPHRTSRARGVSGMLTR